MSEIVFFFRILTPLFGKKLLYKQIHTDKTVTRHIAGRIIFLLFKNPFFINLCSAYLMGPPLKNKKIVGFLKENRESPMDFHGFVCYNYHMYFYIMRSVAKI